MTSRWQFLMAAALGAVVVVPATAEVGLTRLGAYESGRFAVGGAEIVAFDPSTDRVFVVNAADVTVDVLDVRDPRRPTRVGSIDARAYGASANSLAVRDGVLAVAVEASPKTAPGTVVFYRTSNLRVLGKATVGALPDMLTFSPDGQRVVVANEGEPNADYSVDPEGSVSVIDVSGGFRHPRVCTAGFAAFEARRDELVAAGVRLFGPNASVAQDLEPEYLTIAGDRAYVTLQENNAIATVDIRQRCRVEAIQALGVKDHSLPGNGLDASDRDNAVRIANWPVSGLYLPDGIDTFNVRGQRFLITANEGDAREYQTFAEEARVGALDLDNAVFPNESSLKTNANLGRLTVTRTLGDHDGDGDYDQLFVLGGRSFSIWDARTGEQVYDSGDLIERIVAERFPTQFNTTHDANGSFDTRSDNKGPEPEGVVVGKVGRSLYAFVGLERMGGVMMFDVSEPASPRFIDYAMERNFAAPIEQAGDLGPEGLAFVSAADSPTRQPLLIVGNEISGTTTLYEISEP